MEKIVDKSDRRYKRSREVSAAAFQDVLVKHAKSLQYVKDTIAQFGGWQRTPDDIKPNLVNILRSIDKTINYIEGEAMEEAPPLPHFPGVADAVARRAEISSLVASLGLRENERWTIEQAQNDVLQHLRGARGDLKGRDWDLIIDVLAELITQNPGTDFRGVGFLLEERRALVGRRKLQEGQALVKADWFKRCDESEGPTNVNKMAKTIQVPIPGIGLVEPYASNEDGSVSDRIDLHIPIREQLGYVYSTSSKEEAVRVDWQNQLDETREKVKKERGYDPGGISIGRIIGARWEFLPYRPLEPDFKSFKDWLEQELQKLAKTYLELPKIVTIRHPSNQIIHGPGFTFIPGTE